MSPPVSIHILHNITNTKTCTAPHYGSIHLNPGHPETLHPQPACCSSTLGTAVLKAWTLCTPWACSSSEETSLCIATPLSDWRCKLQARSGHQALQMCTSANIQLKYAIANMQICSQPQQICTSAIRQLRFAIANMQICRSANMPMCR